MRALHVRNALAACLLLALPAGGGCGSYPVPTTVRLVDGKQQESRYVSPEAYAHYARAELHLQRGQLARAAEELELALLSDPDSPHLHTKLAAVLANAGAFDEARAHIDQALAIEPLLTDALLLKGKVEWAQHRPREAEACLRRCIGANPAAVPCTLALATMLEETEEPARARGLLEGMLVRVPRATEGHSRLAVLCLRELDYPCAARHLERVLSEDADPDALLRLAHVHRALGNDAAALRVLREAFDRTGGSAIATSLLSLLEQMGDARAIDDLLEVLSSSAEEDLDEARQVAELCLEAGRPRRILDLVAARKGEKDAVLEVLRAEALFRTGDQARAEALLRTMLEGPEGSRAVLRLASQLERRGRLDAAVGVLRDAAARSPDDEEVVLGLSRTLFAAGKEPESQKVVQAVLARKPESRQLRLGLALALERTGRWRDAITEARKIVAKEPKDAAAHNFVGYILADRRQSLDEAERSIRRAIFLDPGQGYIIDSLGWLCFRRGELTRAQALLEMAARLAPKEAEVLEHLAEVNASSRQVERAVALLRRAISVSDDARLTARLTKRMKQLELKLAETH
jgi:Flp pilus assembly protein TadD